MPDRDPHPLQQPEIAAIPDAAVDAITSVDGAQRILQFNSTAEEMFGCRAAEAIDSSLSRFRPERFRAAHAQQVRAYHTSGHTIRDPGELGDIKAGREVSAPYSRPLWRPQSTFPESPPPRGHHYLNALRAAARFTFREAS